MLGADVINFPCINIALRKRLGSFDTSKHTMILLALLIFI